ncbi:hypothetical protein PP1Y_AT23175 [Novosphingobium sp. PP1Y]|nr:hypothetical protein PP1Y_AT23175 [Novosphingobium sp. PP1Y]
MAVNKPEQRVNAGAWNLVPARAGASTTLLFEQSDHVPQISLNLHVSRVRDRDAPLFQIIEKSRCVGAVVPHHDRAVSLADKREIERSDEFVTVIRHWRLLCWSIDPQRFGTE